MLRELVDLIAEFKALDNILYILRKTVQVKPGDDLYLVSGERDLYEGYTIAGIDCTPDWEHIEFGNTEEVALGKAIGDIDEDIVKIKIVNIYINFFITLYDILIQRILHFQTFLFYFLIKIYYNLRYE